MIKTASNNVCSVAKRFFSDEEKNLGTLLGVVKTPVKDVCVYTH